MNNQKDQGTAQLYHQKLMQLAEVFTAMLGILLRLVLFEECNSQWSISRPLLILILLYPKEFEAFKEQLIMNQPVEHRQVNRISRYISVLFFQSKSDFKNNPIGFTGSD